MKKAENLANNRDFVSPETEFHSAAPIPYTVESEEAQGLSTLELERNKNRELTDALQEAVQLVTSLTYNLQQLVLVLAEETHELLYQNFSASVAAQEFPSIPGSFLSYLKRDNEVHPAGCAFEFVFHTEQKYLHYSVTAYPFLWNGTKAKVYLLNETGKQKSEDMQKNQKTQCGRDLLTDVHNRFAGMMLLNKWLDRNRKFVLCLTNMDNLKYINNAYGREEGDFCIVQAAKLLVNISPDVVVARAGGDEFMVLFPGLTKEESRRRMDHVSGQLKELLADKAYCCDVSYGLVAVEGGNAVSASILLKLADDRMHQSKLKNKKKRLLL